MVIVLLSRVLTVCFIGIFFVVSGVLVLFFFDVVDFVHVDSSEVVFAQHVSSFFCGGGFLSVSDVFFEVESQVASLAEGNKVLF